MSGATQTPDAKEKKTPSASDAAQAPEAKEKKPRQRKPAEKGEPKQRKEPGRKRRPYKKLEQEKLDVRIDRLSTRIEKYKKQTESDNGLLVKYLYEKQCRSEDDAKEKSE